MLDNIPAALLNGIGVVGLVVVFFWLLSRGTLRTGVEVERMERAHERELGDVKADRDIWRDNFFENKGLTSQLLAGQETTNRLLRAIPHVEDRET